MRPIILGDLDSLHIALIFAMLLLFVFFARLFLADNECKKAVDMINGSECFRLEKSGLLNRCVIYEQTNQANNP